MHLIVTWQCPVSEIIRWLSTGCQLVVTRSTWLLQLKVVLPCNMVVISISGCFVHGISTHAYTGTKLKSHRTGVGHSCIKHNKQHAAGALSVHVAATHAYYWYNHKVN